MIDAIKCPNNKPAWIVGGGPSLSNFNWSLLDNKFVIALNRAYEILPKADIIYFTDNDWWYNNKDNLLKHPAVKVKGSVANSLIRHPQVHEYIFSSLPRGYEKTPGMLCHGYNSGCAVINLAVVHLHFREVYLLGYDMQWKNNISHWHSGYANNRVSSEVYQTHMIDSFVCLLPMLEEYKAKVYNVCPDSALQCFPKLTFDQAFSYK